MTLLTNVTLEEASKVTQGYVDPRASLVNNAEASVSNAASSAYAMKTIDTLLTAQMDNADQPVAAPKLGSSVDPINLNNAPAIDPNDPDAAIAKIRQMLVILGYDGEQWNIFTQLTEYMTECYKTFKGDNLARFMNRLNGVTIIGNSGTTSLGKLIAEQILAAKFYATGGKYQETRDFLNKWVAELKAAGADTKGGPLADTLRRLQDLQKGTELDDWMKNRSIGGQDGHPNMDYNTALIVIKGETGWFFQTSNALLWRNFQWLFDILEKLQAWKGKDPGVILMWMMMYVLPAMGDERGSEMGAYSTSIDKLTKGSSTMSELMNIYKAGNWNTKNSMDFLDKMFKQMQIDGSSYKTKDVAELVKTAFNGILDYKTDGGKGPSIRELYEKAKAGGPEAAAAETTIANAFHGLSPSATDPTKDLKQWTANCAALDNATKAYTNVGSQLSVQYSQKTNDDNSDNGVVKSLGQMIMQMIQSINKRTGKQ